MSPTEFCDLTNACHEGRKWAVVNCRDMDHAWATARPTWLIWIATRPGVLDNRTLRRFAVWSARQVQHLMTDPRSLAALDVAERHADGQATFDELRAARAAARDAFVAECGAARDAARSVESAAWDAEDDAANAAAYDAELSAAHDAAAWSKRDVTKAAERAAAQAADAAARDAARTAQAAWLRANATPDWARVKRQMGGAR